MESLKIDFYNSKYRPITKIGFTQTVTIFSLYPNFQCPFGLENGLFGSRPLMKLVALCLNIHISKIQIKMGNRTQVMQ